MSPPARSRLSAPTLPLVFAFAVCLVEGPARAQPPQASPTASARADDEAAIRAATGRYVEALSRGDGTALADMWTPDGDIIDDEGRVTNGREAVSGIAPADGPRREPTIRETRLRFVTADVAIEDGVVTIAPPDGGEPHEGWFSATWVRQEQGWRLAGLRESRITSPRDAASLADLSWMVGDWTVAEDQ
ncbi:MAG: nuclear transport factor 2 family protein, partial [Planctomycetia bacterium]